MMICIGGVCIPLNLLIPFLVGVMHRYGWFRWFKQEWVTVSYWKKRYRRWSESNDDAENTGPDLKRAENELKQDEQEVRKAVDAATSESADDKVTKPLRRREGSKGQDTKAT